MANIRPKDLPAAPSVTNAVALVIDTGADVQRATPLQIMDAGRPLASQAEAEAGTDNAKIMSPLRVAQAVTTALVTPLDGKENSIATGANTQYWRGDKTWQTLNKASVGLSNVDNIASATLLARANHTGTQSADTLTDGTTNKAFLATERTKLTGIATGATANSADATLLARTNHTGTQSADTLTDGTTNKAFLATERTKLTGIAIGATANSADATLLSRANHTGTQASTTVTWLQSGTGATSRTAEAKMRDLGAAEDFGAVGDGTTNDSAAFTAGLTAKASLRASASKSYAIKDLAFTNHNTILGSNATFLAATGGTNLAALADFNPRISDLYVSSGANASQALFRVKASRGARIENIMAVNVGAGVVNLSPVTAGTDVIALPVLQGIRAEQVTGTAFFIGQNVSELQGGTIHAQGNLVAGTGGLKPAPGTVGWRQNQPLSGVIARGGHQMSRMNMIAFETGWYFTDVELLMYDNIYADSCAGFGIVFDGTGNADGIQLNSVYIGTTRGFYGGGNSNVSIDGLTTLYNGQIFSWMGSDFYNGTAYDVTLASTAKLTISGYWRGDKKLNIASTAKLIINCGEKFKARSVGTIGPGTTGYLAEWGQTGGEDDAIWRAPCPGRVIGITAYPTNAPGASQTFIYTLRKSFADTAFVVTLSGASAFGGDNWSATGGIAYAAGDPIAIKLVTSAGAAAARHNVILHFVPD